MQYKMSHLSATCLLILLKEWNYYCHDFTGYVLVLKWQITFRILAAIDILAGRSFLEAGIGQYLLLTRCSKMYDVSK